jgi:hypothetical protein
MATTFSEPPGIDMSAPTVLSFNPGSAALGVALGANIVLTFSEAVQRGTGSIVLKTAAGTTIASYDAATSGNISISGNTLTLNPSADLSYASGYTLTFAAGSIKDLAGNAYAGSSSYGFSTVQGTLPGTPATAGSDVFTAVAGHYALDGLGGTDTLQLGQVLAAYAISPTSTGYSLSATDGSANYGLTNVERLVFSDGHALALDLGTSQSAGQTELLLGAVLGKNLLASKPVLVGSALALFDSGNYSMQVLAGALMRLPIWGDLANGGGATASNTQIANYLLNTVNGVAPDAATLASAVTALNTETGAAQGNFLWHLAESAANQIQVDLVGLTNTGLAYLSA